MDIQQLILDALGQSPNAIPYFVSQRLKRYFPDHALLEASDRDFDLHGYGADGSCQIFPLDQVHGQALTSWNSNDRHIEKQPFNAAYEITWQGHSLTAVQLHWSAGWSTVRYLWLLSEREAIAEAFFHAVCDWSTEIRDEILVFDNGNWSKNTELYKSIKGTTLENLVLPGSLKEDIHGDVKRFFESRQFYSQHDLAWKRGLLLIGPPGNGKTHMVKALINDLKLPCLYIKNFKDRSNPGAFNIRRVFEKARHMAPCILVLEDLDSLIGEETRSCFLNELDGFAVNEGILTLATTNHPERIDMAILERPSRFDRKYQFTLPDEQERQTYLAGWNNRLQDDMKLMPEAIAQLTDQTIGFSFAYLKELCLSSMMGWMESREPGSMEQVIIEQLPKLQEQISSDQASRVPKESESSNLNH